MAAVKAKPATFDRTAQRRRALLGKVHIAKKQLQMADDDYQAVVFRHCGSMSAADANEAQLVAIVDEMKAKGFKAIPAIGRAPAGARRVADHPSARLARAMWISLHQLGAVDNPSEEAFEAFAKRQLKVEKLQWANQSQSYKLIEALKAMGARLGWDQSVDGVKKDAVTTLRKRRLVHAIHRQLIEKGAVPSSWTLDEVVFRLTGGEIQHGTLFLSIEQAETVARDLGAKLREYL